MSYRAKSPERAIQEFHALATRYGVRRFTAVDNIIDMQYHQRVLPLLAGHGYDIFYETKANLRRHHMQGFADAGVRSIQPGMESFHDEMLRTLAKGNKAWMNVQILKWAIELEMKISWVFLIDVPRQRDEWYWRCWPGASRDAPGSAGVRGADPVRPLQPVPPRGRVV